MDEIQSQLLASLDSTLNSIRQLAEQVNSQLDGDKVKTILANVETVTESLKGSSRDLQRLLHGDMPRLVAEVDSILGDVQKLASNVSQADIAALVVKADSTLAELNAVIASANDTHGTVGMLLHDNKLYENVNNAVLTADSLMTDLREEPNSIIWGKKKSRQMRKEARKNK
jgi:phospholipid/cholesterol/gamma-HCH transport system substrate-binding protein